MICYSWLQNNETNPSLYPAPLGFLKSTIQTPSIIPFIKRRSGRDTEQAEVLARHYLAYLHLFINKSVRVYDIYVVTRAHPSTYWILFYLAFKLRPSTWHRTPCHPLSDTRRICGNRVTGIFQIPRVYFWLRCGAFYTFEK